MVSGIYVSYSIKITVSHLAFAGYLGRYIRIQFAPHVTSSRIQIFTCQWFCFDAFVVEVLMRGVQEQEGTITNKFVTHFKIGVFTIYFDMNILHF